MPVVGTKTPFRLGLNQGVSGSPSLTGGLQRLAEGRLYPIFGNGTEVGCAMLAQLIDHVALHRVPSDKQRSQSFGQFINGLEYCPN